MSIRDYLTQGKPLLFDGAMGTWYAAQPGRAEARCELANLHTPQEIAAIHRAYLEAGCKAVRTNTFDLSGDWETAEKIIRALVLQAPEWISMCENALLPPDLKERLIRIIWERVSVLK